MKTTDYPFAVQDEECFTYSGYVYCVGGDGPNANTTDSYGRTDAVFYARFRRRESASGRPQLPSPTLYLPALHGEWRAHLLHLCHIEGEWLYIRYGRLLCFAVTQRSRNMGSDKSAALCDGGMLSHRSIRILLRERLSYYAPLSSEGIGPWSNTTSIPVKYYAGYFTAESYIYFMGIPVYFAPASSSGIGPWESTTNYPNATHPGSCVSSSVHVYCLGGYGTNSSCFAEIGVPNPYALHLQNTPPFSNPEFLGPAWTGSGGCSTSFLTNGTFAGAPYFTADIDEAVVFNCLAAASTPTGCKTTVVSPTRTSYNYNMTVWYLDSSLGPSPSRHQLCLRA